jgi:DNA replicative helicase MCM subunit Mcm2 (Cdc46/Mcm family)
MNAPAYDFPKSEDEKGKCVDFLRNFLVAGKYRKYVDQMQEISNRQRKVLEISVDDLFDHKNDDEFVNNVKNNTCRYLRYFEEAADELLPAASVQNREKDVFDILQVYVALLLICLNAVLTPQSIVFKW